MPRLRPPAPAHAGAAAAVPPAWAECPPAAHRRRPRSRRSPPPLRASRPTRGCRAQSGPGADLRPARVRWRPAPGPAPARRSGPLPRRRGRRRCRTACEPWSAEAAASALGELRPLTRLLEPGLLALLDPGVAGEEAAALEVTAQVGLGVDQSPRDPVAQRARLSGDAAAVQAGHDVHLGL